MNNLFDGVYKNKKIFITGHNGFKGSWLCLWLNKLGAKVCGYSLSPQYKYNHIDLLKLRNIDHINGDIRDLNLLKKTLSSFEPDIVFHLAAQAIVKISYSSPIETLMTNVIGTANVIEACRGLKSVKAIINVTSDKCYENKEWVWGYREFDELGGYDPYSASKACSEIITKCYRNSFFNINDFNINHNTLIATCRAGNVIGGGDWGAYRLIPDIVKSITEGEKLIIRYPNAIRPWQHVLEPLSGYLLLGKELLIGKKEMADAWNFSTHDSENIKVIDILNYFEKSWKKVEFEILTDKKLHETTFLRLDSSKANFILNWKNVWSVKKAIQKTIDWYKFFYQKNLLLSEQDLEEYITDACKMKAIWTI